MLPNASHGLPGTVLDVSSAGWKVRLDSWGVAWLPASQWTRVAKPGDRQTFYILGRGSDGYGMCTVLGEWEAVQVAAAAAATTGMAPLRLPCVVRARTSLSAYTLAVMTSQK